MAESSCPLNAPATPPLEVVSLHPDQRVDDYREAMALAKVQAEQRFAEYMLLSWYDRDRDFESPANASECAAGCPKNGYALYGLSHGARLKVDIEGGRFVFFFAPVEW